MGTRCPQWRLGWELGATFFLLAAMCPPVGAASGSALNPPGVSAAGRHESILTVPTFGRYAVSVRSKQGTALQIIDRLAGPGMIAGQIGKTDGRTDLFLDRGTYKVVTLGHERSAGTAELTAAAFTEQNGATPPLLVELKPVETTLDDLQQRSYWIDIPERRRIYLEAAGRNLTDLRVWSNGDWIVDLTPTCTVTQPVPGKPLQRCELAADLNPGLYLLSAYGGPSQPWAEQSAAHPFHLRWGIPRLPETGRSRRTISPFGIDRWIVPKDASYFRVELPEARPVTLGVRSITTDDWFNPPTATQQIDKNSLVPVAEIETDGGDHLVSVTGEAGQSYILQHLNLGERYLFGGRVWQLHVGQITNYWVSTVHSGDPSDSIDATAIVMRVPRYRAWPEHFQPFATQVLELGPESIWVRQANLLSPISAFVHIRAAGKYEILSQGARARFRLEPFFISPPATYQSPERQRSPSTWDLDPGYYVLSGEPERMGIVDVAVRGDKAANDTDPFARLRGKDRSLELHDLIAAAQFPELSIDPEYNYMLFINDQPEVRVGMVLRPLPLDPTDALPIMQKPNEEIAVPIRLKEPAILRGDADDGSSLKISVDGAKEQAAPTVAAGDHRITIRHTGADPIHYMLSAELMRMRSSAPLPSLADPQRAAPPRLPVLTSKQPQYLDLERAADATFLLRADKPALYRLQSTGLLETEGNLRTRTNPSFYRRAANGVGRNFYIDQYLREGDYQVTVTTQGTSKGHLGMTLDRTEMVDGGTIAEGAPGRIGLAAGSAVVYRFTISEAGRYRVRSIGVGTTFLGRLEDADGWPIEPPNLPADITRHFDPGTYQIVSLPEPVSARRLTILERVAEPTQHQGHGPHPLHLDEPTSFVWLEPEPGQERTPDVWQFELAAPVDAAIELSNEMQGRLLREDGDAPAAAVPPSRGWRGRLAAGSYRLEVMCSRTNNRQDYTVAVRPDQLVAGLDRMVAAPATIPVSVGQEGMVQLSSFGSVDVRARLYDQRDQLIASNDDGPDDWNFQIHSRLLPGFYRLQVDPGGGAVPQSVVPEATATPTPVVEDSEYEDDSNEGEAAEATADEGDDTDATADPERVAAEPTPSTLISMRAPAEVTRQALALPSELTTELGGTIDLYPLEHGAREELLLVSLKAADSVGSALETRDKEDVPWRVVGSAVGRRPRLAVPLSTSEYRLRIWSLDGRRVSTRIQVAGISPRRFKENDLKNGVTLTAVPKLDPPTGVAALQIDRPGLFRFGSGHAVRTTARVDVAAAEAPNDLVSATGSRIWLIGDLSKPTATRRVRGVRVPLRPGTERALQVEVRGDTPALCDFAKPTSAVSLAMATSMTGQPGARIVDLASGKPIEPDGRSSAMARSAAVAVALEAKQPAAFIWQAEAGPAMDVRVAQLNLAVPERESLALGSWKGSVSGVAARSADLHAGAKRLRMSLPEGTVAALSTDGTVASVHWNGNQPFEETLDTTANRLTLIHTSAGDDPFSIDVLPLAQTDVRAPLALGSPFELAVANAGQLRLPLAPASESNLMLHIRGSSDLAQLVSVDGRVARGVDLAVPPAGGSVTIPHEPGLVLAWIDRGSDTTDLFGAAIPAAAAETTVPSLVALSGTTQAMRISPSQPMMLHVRSTTPLISLLQSEGRPARIAPHPHGCALDAYIASPTQLALRALQGSTLSGSAEITASPVTQIKEGIGPEVLLAAGTTRLFSFTVEHEGAVGFGVRADPDVVLGTLLDATGAEIAHGVVNMHTLKPGTYLLSIHAPAEGGPVRARPALAGVTLPSTGPPDDVVRSYLTLAQRPDSSPPGTEENLEPSMVTDEH